MSHCHTVAWCALSLHGVHCAFCAELSVELTPAHRTEACGARALVRVECETEAKRNSHTQCQCNEEPHAAVVCQDRDEAKVMLENLAASKLQARVSSVAVSAQHCTTRM